MDIVKTFENYTIYRCNKDNSFIYYLCKPNIQMDIYNLYIGLPDSNISKIEYSDLINDIGKIADVVTSNYLNGVYLLPVIPDDILDKNTINLEYGNEIFSQIYIGIICPLLNDVCYNKLNQKVSSKIRMIKDNSFSIKFFNWLETKNKLEYGETKASEFMVSIDYNELIKLGEIDKVNLESIYITSDSENGGASPVNGDFGESIENDKPYTRRKVKPKSFSSGFSNIHFIIVTLILSLILGIGLGVLLMK